MKKGIFLTVAVVFILSLLQITTYPQGRGRSPKEPEDAPPGRNHHSAMYDPEQTRMVIFGGCCYTGMFSDCWSLDLKSLKWTKLSPLTVKMGRGPGRYGQSAIYDSKKKRMVIFAGVVDEWFGLDDTWSFDLGNLKWEKLETKGEPPAKRGYHSAIYDSGMNRMIVFGGYDQTKGQQSFSDCWSLDLATLEWKKLEIKGAGPSARYGHRAIYDEKGNRMVIHGGSGGGSETWSLELKNLKWEKLATKGTAPKVDQKPVVYDAEANRIVVLTGADVGQPVDTWAIDLKALEWKKLTTKGEAPCERGDCSSIYDSKNRTMIIFAGWIRESKEGENFLSDTWSLDLKTLEWKKLKTTKGE